MNEVVKSILIAVLCVIALIVVAIIFGGSIDIVKNQCIESGGKWVTGYIGGEYSYFCMPL